MGSTATGDNCYGTGQTEAAFERLRRDDDPNESASVKRRQAINFFCRFEGGCGDFVFQVEDPSIPPSLHLSQFRVLVLSLDFALRSQKDGVVLLTADLFIFSQDMNYNLFS
ncbi:hypothetical protein QYF36_013211 [Acer negundo]|nr:hypothetical protein QYF36_013211 [Acer negundo]